MEVGAVSRSPGEPAQNRIRTAGHTLHTMTFIHINTSYPHKHPIYNSYTCTHVHPLTHTHIYTLGGNRIDHALRTRFDG